MRVNLLAVPLPGVGLLIPQYSPLSSPKRRSGNDLLQMCQYVDKPLNDQSVGEKSLTLPV